MVSHNRQGVASLRFKRIDTLSKRIRLESPNMAGQTYLYAPQDDNEDSKYTGSAGQMCGFQDPSFTPLPHNNGTASMPARLLSFFFCCRDDLQRKQLLELGLVGVSGNTDAHKSEHELAHVAMDRFVACAGAFAVRLPPSARRSAEQSRSLERSFDGRIDLGSVRSASAHSVSHGSSLSCSATTCTNQQPSAGGRTVPVHQRPIHDPASVLRSDSADNASVGL